MIHVRVSLNEIEAVYRSRGADFFRLALARTSDREAALDDVQEGFARAIRGRRSYRGAGPLEAWIARCIMNAAHDLRAPHTAGLDADGNVVACLVPATAIDGLSPLSACNG